MRIDLFVLNLMGTLLVPTLIVLYIRTVHGGIDSETIDLIIENNPANLLLQEDDDLDTGVSPGESVLWGPGLRPDEIVLPARYFFVQLKGKGGKRIPRKDVDRDELRVRIDCSGDREIWTQILESGDDEASFIVRYKVMNSCHSQFRIIVTYSHVHLTDSPIIVNAPVLPDTCDCPQLQAKDWLVSAGCPSTYAQLANDLRPFPNASVQFDDVLERVLQKYYRPTAYSFCHYAIVKNTVYRRCYGEHTAFHIFSDAILLFLTRHMRLPDVEFLMNLGDYPVVKKTQKGHDFPLPFFSWCKTPDNLDILVPTYELTEASLEAMGRVSLDTLTVQANVGVKWDNKTDQIFWRGRDSHEQRLELVRISRAHPTFFNVSLTNFFFYRDREPEFGPIQSRISFFKFFNYKYQLNIDGTVAAYRFPFLLAGDAVVFKVDSSYIEHFYRDLSPYQHYIPVKPDLSDLLDQLKWARGHDDEVKKIGINGKTYVRKNLMPLNVFCYHAKAYTEWADRLKSPVVIRPGMEVVKQSKVSHSRICDCPSHLSEVKEHEAQRQGQDEVRSDDKLEL